MDRVRKRIRLLRDELLMRNSHEVAITLRYGLRFDFGTCV